jgi:HEAT repeat protein
MGRTLRSFFTRDFIRRFAVALLALAGGAFAAAPARAQAVPLAAQCDALGENQSEGVNHALAALGGKDLSARVAAAQELGAACEKRAVAPLVSLLGDEDPLVRVAAVESLGRLGDRSAIDPLIELTGDGDWRVRLALARALCAFQQPRASYAALNFILGKGEPQDADDMRPRAAAAVAVHQLRDASYSRKALIILLSFAEKPSEPVRRVARETLYALKETRNGSIEFVGLLKQSRNPYHRRDAAYWIGELRLERGRDALGEVAANDPDAEVRKVAAAALAKLGKAVAEQ